MLHCCKETFIQCKIGKDKHKEVQTKLLLLSIKMYLFYINYVDKKCYQKCIIMRYFMGICCYWFFKIKKNKEITLQNWQSLKHHQALTQKVPTHNRAKTQHKTSPLSKTHYISMRYTFVLKVMHSPPSSLNWWNHMIATMNRNVFYSVHPP